MSPAVSPSVGIDVGGSTVKAVVVAGTEVVHSLTVARSSPDPADEVMAIAADLARVHAARSLGLALAGLVRWPEGVFVWGPHVPGTRVEYRARLEQDLGIPVAVDNDANAAALCEWKVGAARGAENLVLLTVGSGIGGGLVIDGALRRGRSFAGEVGHITVQPDGALCACGRRGCWETLVSGEVLDREALRLAAEVSAGAGGRHPTAVDLVAAAEAGDRSALDVLERVGRRLGEGIVSLVLALDPEVVVVGGAVSAAGDMLLRPAREAIASSLPGAAVRPPVPVVPARFGALAGAVGAALLARGDGA